MAHKLGAYHHLPHGVANALLICEVMRFNAEEVPTKMGTFSQYQYPHTLERYAECAHFCGVCGKDDSETLELFIQKMSELKARVGIKKTIRDYGVDEKYFLETLDQMVEDAFDDQCTGADPRYPLLGEIKPDVPQGLLTANKSKDSDRKEKRMCRKIKPSSSQESTRPCMRRATRSSKYLTATIKNRMSSTRRAMRRWYRKTAT